MHKQASYEEKAGYPYKIASSVGKLRCVSVLLRQSLTRGIRANRQDY